MTPISRPKTNRQLNLGRLKGRKVIANFDGGKITSDAGIVLMAELDQKLKITARFAECFRDYRNSPYVDYSVHEPLAQRAYAIVLGYEDVNDHDKLSLFSDSRQKRNRNGTEISSLKKNLLID